MGSPVNRALDKGLQDFGVGTPCERSQGAGERVRKEGKANTWDIIKVLGLNFTRI